MFLLARLEKILVDFAQARIASFDAAAAGQFDLLRKRRIRIGTMDLRIAATALANPGALAKNKAHSNPNPVASAPHRSPASAMPACDAII